MICTSAYYLALPVQRLQETKRVVLRLVNAIANATDKPNEVKTILRQLHTGVVCQEQAFSDSCGCLWSCKCDWQM